MPDTKIDIAGAIERAKLASPLACPTSLGWKAWVKDLQILGNQLEQSQREVEMLKAPDDLEDRKAELMVPLTDEMARAQADLYLDMKARAESSQARVAELTAEVERANSRIDGLKEELFAAWELANSLKKVSGDALTFLQSIEGAGYGGMSNYDTVIGLLQALQEGE